MFEENPGSRTTTYSLKIYKKILFYIQVLDRKASHSIDVCRERKEETDKLFPKKTFSYLSV